MPSTPPSPPPRRARPGRRACLGLPLLALLPAWPLRAQPAPPPSAFEGHWRAETPKPKGQEGLQIAGGQLRFINANGSVDAKAVPYRIDGARLLFDVPAGTPPPPAFTLRSDGRLVSVVPDVGLVVFVRAGPVTPSPAAAAVPAAPRADTTPVATGHVAPIRGRYVQENAPRGGLDFRDGHVRFVEDGRETVMLPMLQQGAKLTIVGPHMEEVLWVLQDGRLRLSREGMRPVFYRRP